MPQHLAGRPYVRLKRLGLSSGTCYENSYVGIWSKTGQVPGSGLRREGWRACLSCGGPTAHWSLHATATFNSRYMVHVFLLEINAVGSIYRFSVHTTHGWKRFKFLVASAGRLHDQPPCMPASGSSVDGPCACACGRHTAYCTMPCCLVTRRLCVSLVDLDFDFYFCFYFAFAIRHVQPP